MVELSGFNRLRTFGDYSRAYDEEERQFQLRKDLAEAKKAAMNASLRARRNDPEFIAAQALQQFYRTGQMPEGGVPAIKTLAMMQGEKTSYEPDAFGNIKAVTRPNPYKQILSQFEQPAQSSGMPAATQPQVGAEALPSQPSTTLQQLPADSSPAEYDVTQMQQLPDPDPDMAMQWPKMLQQQMQQVDPEVAQSPIGRMEVFREGLNLASDITKLNAEDQLKRAEEELKTQSGRQKVVGIVERMATLNDELKKKSAIVSKDMSLSERLRMMGSGTELRKGARKVTNPEAEAMAAEYEALRSTLLPYYANAAGLGAKSLDSEGERKSILEAFGNPYGIYETNTNQLNNLRQLFGTQQKTTPQTNETQINPIRDRLKQAGYTDEQIDEFMSLEGLQ